MYPAFQEKIEIWKKMSDYCSFQRQVDRGLALLRGCCLWQQSLHLHVGGSGSDLNCGSGSSSVFLFPFLVQLGPLSAFLVGPFPVCCVWEAVHLLPIFSLAWFYLYCILDFLIVTSFCNVIYSPSSWRWWEQAVICVPTALFMLMGKSLNSTVPFLPCIAFVLSFILFNLSFLFHPHILCLLLPACSPPAQPHVLTNCVFCLGTTWKQVCCSWEVPVLPQWKRIFQGRGSD